MFLLILKCVKIITETSREKKALIHFVNKRYRDFS